MNVAEHLPFIYTCAHQMNIQDEEIIGDAILRAVQVAPRYDPEQGTEANYLFKHVKGALIRGCRKQQRHGMTGEIPEGIRFTSYPLRDREGREIEVAKNHRDYGINWPLIERAMNRGSLTEFQKQIVRLRICGFLFQEIADKLDALRQSVNEAYNKALEKMNNPEVKELLC